MFDFLGNRLQKTLSKMKAKTTLNEEDILLVTKEIKLALLEADVNLLVVKEFINNVKEKAIGSQIVGKLNPSQQMIKIVRDELVEVLGGETREMSITKKPFVMMMTGLQGSGKTTTTAKIAKFLIKKGKVSKPLMIAADVYRPAAIEQLITLGKELQIDVFSMGKISPLEIVEKGLEKANNEGYDLVLIDTAGRLSIDESLMQELENIKKISRPSEIIFVTDSLAGQDIINVAKTFNEKINLTGTVITKLDSDARGGAALSLRHILKLPILFIGTGEKTSNIDIFHPDRMAERILGMGDVLSLIEMAQDMTDEKKSEKMLTRMISGKFDLNDLLDQMRQMKKMGKMSKILKMIPGMAGKISEDKLESAEKKLWLFEILISSMTDQERKNPKLLKQSDRKARIMKGSGRNAQEFNSLVNEFERMSKQMKEMSKQMGSGGNPFGRFGMGM